MDSDTLAPCDFLQDTLLDMSPADMRAALCHQHVLIQAYQMEWDTLTNSSNNSRPTKLLLPCQHPVHAVSYHTLLYRKSWMPPKTNAEDFYGSAITFSENSRKPMAVKQPGARLCYPFSWVKHWDWASAVWDSDPQVKMSANYFANQIKEAFDYPAGGRDISVQLLELHQGSDLAA